MLSFYDMDTLMKTTMRERLRLQSLSRDVREGAMKRTAQRRMEREIERFVRSEEDADIVLHAVHQILPRTDAGNVQTAARTSPCS
jgi:hypothetical protein